MTVDIAAELAAAYSYAPDAAPVDDDLGPEGGLS